ncbi:MAG: 50S ribosomal protein L22 [Candidatus Paceibacterota bacterium]|jgi:large subunit ribosomal protein L22|nr:50S ribosomal protein L22 [Candidatus Paceibacterota bacterium]
METGTASLKNYRQSPRKVRLLADLVKGKETKEAITLLRFSDKRASDPIAKLLESAVANVRNAGAGAKDLYRVVNMTVDQGIVMKRSMPRARGRAFPIKKRTSHVVVTIARFEPTEKAAKGKKETKKAEPKAEKKAAVKKSATKEKSA